jgi:hypothetical protein
MANSASLPEDDDERARDLYAHFGLAYYLAAVLEEGLAQAIMQADFLVRKRDAITAAGAAGFDRAAYEAQLDSYMERVNRMTAGAMARQLAQVTKLDPALVTQIERAIERRNFLAHHFFRERVEKFYSRQGQDELLAELLGDQELFGAVDRAVHAAMAPIREAVGMPEDLLQAHVATHLAKIHRKP